MSNKRLPINSPVWTQLESIENRLINGPAQGQQMVVYWDGATLRGATASSRAGELIIRLHPYRIIGIFDGQVRAGTVKEALLAHLQECES